MEHAYLGPEFSDEVIKRIVLTQNLEFTEYNEEELLQKAAQFIHNNKTVGWFQGRLEFGPRALGNRSILANATNPEMVNILNDKIKHREWFRPFAPIVQEDRVNDFFEMNGMSPFMLLAPRVREHARTILPAITHIDGTARVQTVSKKYNPRLYKLLIEIEKLCGVPVAINTSFNLHGEPIVCTPDEAINDFLKSEMDYLIMGNLLIQK